MKNSKMLTRALPLLVFAGLSAAIGHAETPGSADISTPTTWSGEISLTKQQVVVSSDASLTIEAGAMLTLQPVFSIGQSTQLVVNSGARLIVSGTSGSPVTLRMNPGFPAFPVRPLSITGAGLTEQAAHELRHLIIENIAAGQPALVLNGVNQNLVLENVVLRSGNLSLANLSGIALWEGEPVQGFFHYIVRTPATGGGHAYNTQSVETPSAFTITININRSRVSESPDDEPPVIYLPLARVQAAEDSLRLGTLSATVDDSLYGDNAATFSVAATRGEEDAPPGLFFVEGNALKMSAQGDDPDVGTYTLTLTATDAFGLAAELTLEVVIQEAVPTFNAEATNLPRLPSTNNFLITLPLPESFAGDEPLVLGNLSTGDDWTLQDAPRWVKIVDEELLIERDKLPLDLSAREKRDFILTAPGLAEGISVSVELVPFERWRVGEAFNSELGEGTFSSEGLVPDKGEFPVVEDRDRAGFKVEEQGRFESTVLGSVFVVRRPDEIWVYVDKAGRWGRLTSEFEEGSLSIDFNRPDPDELEENRLPRDWRGVANYTLEEDDEVTLRLEDFEEGGPDGLFRLEDFGPAINSVSVDAEALPSYLRDDGHDEVFVMTWPIPVVLAGQFANRYLLEMEIDSSVSTVILESNSIAETKVSVNQGNQEVENLFLVTHNSGAKTLGLHLDVNVFNDGIDPAQGDLNVSVVITDELGLETTSDPITIELHSLERIFAEPRFAAESVSESQALGYFSYGVIWLELDSKPLFPLLSVDVDTGAKVFSEVFFKEWILRGEIPDGSEEISRFQWMYYTYPPQPSTWVYDFNLESWLFLLEDPMDVEDIMRAENLFETDFHDLGWVYIFFPENRGIEFNEEEFSEGWFYVFNVSGFLWFWYQPTGEVGGWYLENEDGKLERVLPADSENGGNDDDNGENGNDEDPEL